MRHRLFGGLLAAATLVASQTLTHAQYVDDTGVPGRPEFITPLPTGKPDQNGFFGFTQFIMGTQTFGLGGQAVAFRGLVDSSGVLTGQPGTFVGNRQVPALSTDQFGRKSWSPGYEVGLGYKFENGVTVSIRGGQLTQIKYSAGAAGASPPLGLARPDLSDTFLYSPVFNFPPAYAGPDVETDLDITGQNPSGNFYGIWNGASVMDIQYDQRFTYGEIAARVPLFQTDYSRVYGFAGARYAWFFERFYWRTVAQDILGRSFPQDVAVYTNTLSQRMYGPMLGCGHEVYMGKRFAIGMDLSVAGLMNVAKQRAKYKLGDDSTQAKRSRNEFEIVPNINTDVTLMWYPIEGVQLKVGYSFQSYFMTRYMAEPIAFDFGAMDPEYRTRGFRYAGVFNLGIGFFF